MSMFVLEQSLLTKLQLLTVGKLERVGFKNTVVIFYETEQIILNPS